MSIQNQRQLGRTRKKLRELEERCTSLKHRPVSEDEAHIRELTLGSFQRLVQQLKEEIARYEARARPLAKTE